MVTLPVRQHRGRMRCCDHEQASLWRADLMPQRSKRIILQSACLHGWCRGADARRERHERAGRVVERRRPRLPADQHQRIVVRVRPLAGREARLLLLHSLRLSLLLIHCLCRGHQHRSRLMRVLYALLLLLLRRLRGRRHAKHVGRWTARQLAIRVTMAWHRVPKWLLRRLTVPELTAIAGVPREPRRP